MELADTVHVFEQAGLGKAPFAVVGCELKVFSAGPDGPTKPGGMCWFCSSPLIQAYVIRSADGRRFTVGPDCVEKTGDVGLRDRVKALGREARIQRSHARQDAKIADVAALLAREDVRAKLAGLPHPLAWKAAQGATMLDWADWMMEHAFRAGKLQVGKAINKALEA